MLTKRRLIKRLLSNQHDFIMRYLETKIPTDAYIAQYSDLMRRIQGLLVVIQGQSSDSQAQIDLLGQDLDNLHFEFLLCFRDHEPQAPSPELARWTLEPQ